MDNKDTMTAQQVRRAGIAAALLAIVGASSILKDYISSDDTWSFWMSFSVMPIAIYLPLDGERLAHMCFCFFKISLRNVKLA